MYVYIHIHVYMYTYIYIYIHIYVYLEAPALSLWMETAPPAPPKLNREARSQPHPTPDSVWRNIT